MPSRTLTRRERIMSMVLATLIAFACPLNALAGQLAGTGTVEIIDPTETVMTLTCGTVADGGGLRYVASGVDAGAGTLTEGQTYRWRASVAGTRICFNPGCTGGVELSESPESFALASETMGGFTVGLQAARDGGASGIYCVAPSGTATVDVRAIRYGKGR